MAEAGKEELTALGRLHRLSRRMESSLEGLPLLDRFPVHVAIGLLFQYVALFHVEKIDGEPEGVFSYDWKNLVILDACRHDTYEEVNGTTGSRISKSSMTRGFIKKNFSEGDFSDTVYVAANPFFHDSKFEKLTGRKPDEVFHEVFHTYETGWDEEESTVLPEKVFSDAKTAEIFYPDKKKIIHFMQPHHPFIGFDLVDTGFENILEGRLDKTEWDLAMRGEVDRETVAKAYRENLEKVMPYVEKIGEFEGKTVVTSDHGNLLGENGLYWHPPWSRAKPLRKVPLTEV